MYSIAMFNKGSYFICALFYFIIQNKNVGAMTDDEVKAEFTKTILQCAKDASMEVKDMFSLASLVVPTDPKVRCVLACAYKKRGLLNDKGMYDVDGAYKAVDQVYKGDENRIKKGKEFVDFCASSINNEEVSDAEKGCDRAALLFKCSVKNAAQFGFKI